MVNENPELCNDGRVKKYRVAVSRQIPHANVPETYSIYFEIIDVESDETVATRQFDFDSKEEFTQFREAFLENTKAYL